MIAHAYSACLPATLPLSRLSFLFALQAPDVAGAALVDCLLELRDAGVQLSTQSIEFLMFEDPAARDEFASALKDKPLVQQTCCTCAAVICKNKGSEEPDSVSCPVIGTESGHVIVLDQNGTQMLLRVQLPSAPAFLSVVGLLDVEYRIAVREYGPAGPRAPAALCVLASTSIHQAKAAPAETPDCRLRPVAGWLVSVVLVALTDLGPPSSLPPRPAPSCLASSPARAVQVACRTNVVYLIKNGEVQPTAIELETAPCGLAQTAKIIIVACMNRAVHAFHTKGKKAYSLYMPAPIVVMELVTVQRARMVRALIVALGTGEVRVYNDKFLVSVYQTNDSLTGLHFGRFGREEHSLVTAGRSGTLTVKILSRKATLEGTSTGAGPPPEQDIPLNIPKKTKLFIEQTQREVEQAVAMHRLFQQDLCRIRLATARSFVKTLSDTAKARAYVSREARSRTPYVCLRLGKCLRRSALRYPWHFSGVTVLSTLFAIGRARLTSCACVPRRAPRVSLRARRCA